MDKAKRNSSLDLLRVLCAVAVVAQHVCSLPTDTILSPCWYILGLLTKFAVPCFIMLSGAFTLCNDSYKDWKNIKGKIIYLFKLYLFCTIVFALLYLYNALRFTHNYSYIISLAKGFIRGVPVYHLWYIPVIIILYVITPLLIYIKEKSGDKILLFIAIFFFGLGMLECYVSNIVYSLGALKYVAYFIMGYLIKKYCKEKNILGVSILALDIIFGCVIIFSITHSYIIYDNVAGAFSYYMIPHSLSIFVAFSLINVKVQIWLRNTTLYVYLFHPLFLDLLLNKDFSNDIYVNIYLKWALTCALSFAFGTVCFLGGVYRRKYSNRKNAK